MTGRASSDRSPVLGGWFAALVILGVAALGAAVGAVHVGLPSVPCTVPSAAQSNALRQASDDVYRWAHGAELLSAAGVVVAVAGLFVTRRSVFVLWAAALLVIGAFAAGYADYAANRGCGI